jgi:drug/metabolite transporter (DMT)-like permease
MSCGLASVAGASRPHRPGSAALNIPRTRAATSAAVTRGTVTRNTGAGHAGAGLALAVLSAATFGTSGTFASALIGTGWSPAAAVLTRIAASALILTVPALIQLRGRWARLRRAAGRVAAYGLIAVAGCQLFYFDAVQRIPVGVALLLEYLGTILVVGWLWVRHGQRPRRLTVIGATAAIGGLFLVLDLGGSARLDPIGVMWGLLAAVGLAVYFLLSAASGGEPLPPIVMAWAGMCIGAAVLAVLGAAGVLPLAFRAAAVDFLGHRVSWIVPVLGLSLLAAVVAYVAGIGAARRLGAKLASFVGMAEVLFAVLFAWVLLGQTPAPSQFLGGASILAGIALVRAGELAAPEIRPSRPAPPETQEPRGTSASTPHTPEEPLRT